MIRPSRVSKSATTPLNFSISVRAFGASARPSMAFAPSSIFLLRSGALLVNSSTFRAYSSTGANASGSSLGPACPHAAGMAIPVAMTAVSAARLIAFRPNVEPLTALPPADGEPWRVHVRRERRFLCLAARLILRRISSRDRRRIAERLLRLAGRVALRAGGRRRWRIPQRRIRRIMQRLRLLGSAGSAHSTACSLMGAYPLRINASRWEHVPEPGIAAPAGRQKDARLALRRQVAGLAAGT
jgi:hypothetical protein